MKAGDVYLRVAEAYSESITGGAERKKVEIFIKAKDYVRLERIVHLEEIIKTGISVLRNALDHEMRQYLPMTYESHVLYGTECEALNLNLLGEERQQAIITVILDTMESMHDAWVRSRLGEFLNNSVLLMKDDSRRPFVPFPLFRWDAVRKYYWMVIALLDGLKPLPDEGMVRGCYEQKTREFCRYNEIRNEETLQEKLMKGAKFYPAIDGSAGEKLVRQKSTQRVVGMIMADIGQIIK